MTLPLSLTEMSDERFRRPFPVVLSPHRPQWKEKCARKKTALKAAPVLTTIVRIYPIDSTDADGSAVRPTLHILTEIDPATGLSCPSSGLYRTGYLYTEQPVNTSSHRIYKKRYLLQGFRRQAFHLHERCPGDRDRLYFYGYPADCPAIAEMYENLKGVLKNRFEYDRNGYTGAKTGFTKAATVNTGPSMVGKYIPLFRTPEKS